MSDPNTWYPVQEGGATGTWEDDPEPTAPTEKGSGLGLLLAAAVALLLFTGTVKPPKFLR